LKVVEVSYLLQMVKKDFCTTSPGSHKKQPAYYTIALLPLGLLLCWIIHMK
jgi:hypothetical protein